MTDALTKIPPGDWENLRDLYLVNWPESCYGYYAIDNYVKRKRKGISLEKLRILCLNGDWSDGTFIIEVSGCWWRVEGRNLHLVFFQYDAFVVFNTATKSTDRLERVLQLFDWTTVYLLMAVRDAHHSTLMKVMNHLHIEPEVIAPTDMYFLSRTKATEFVIE